ncbi:hypothetical protein NL676_004721 [Syzygium grande]|nr:hypothetical protein NL676_004721 [Syzygium grande]
MRPPPPACEGWPTLAGGGRARRAGSRPSPRMGGGPGKGSLARIRQAAVAKTRGGPPHGRRPGGDAGLGPDGGWPRPADRGRRPPMRGEADLAGSPAAACARVGRPRQVGRPRTTPNGAAMAWAMAGLAGSSEGSPCRGSPSPMRGEADLAGARPSSPRRGSAGPRLRRAEAASSGRGRAAVVAASLPPAGLPTVLGELDGEVDSEDVGVDGEVDGDGEEDSDEDSAKE